jgi:hypothetical protein
MLLILSKEKLTCLSSKEFSTLRVYFSSIKWCEKIIYFDVLPGVTPLDFAV